MRKTRRAVRPPPARGRAHPRRAAHGHGHARRPRCCTTSSRTPRSTLDEIRERFGDEVAELVDGVTKLGKIEFESLCRGAEPTTCARCSSRWPRTSASSSSSSPTGCTTCARSRRCPRSGASRRRARRWRSTRRSRTGSASRASSGSSRTSRSTTSSRTDVPPGLSRWWPRAARRARTYLNQVIDQLHDGARRRSASTAEISGRPKHLYSIYQKMTQKGKDFNEIYDLIALRVIVDSVKDCYGALGTVHSIWKPVPGRFKDYVAMPKFNMYQSLHTTVIGPAGRPLEIQIRTEEMHRTAEYGIAAHWRYKEGGKRRRDASTSASPGCARCSSGRPSSRTRASSWRRSRSTSSRTRSSSSRRRATSSRFERGSTPIDFAYAIHTEVGNHCVGAKVNGAIVPLDYELQMGDRVEILTNKNAQPVARLAQHRQDLLGAQSRSATTSRKVSREDDLVSRAATSSPRSCASTACGIGSQDRREGARRGRQGDELRARRRPARRHRRRARSRRSRSAPSSSSSWRRTARPAKRRSRRSRSSRSTTADDAAAQQAAQAQSGGIKVKGIDDVLVRLARCCNPVPGDEIIGFVTRGRGVSVHRADCPNARDLLSQPGAHHRRRVGPRQRRPPTRSRSSSRRSTGCGCCRT